MPMSFPNLSLQRLVHLCPWASTVVNEPECESFVYNHYVQEIFELVMKAKIRWISCLKSTMLAYLMRFLLHLDPFSSMVPIMKLTILLKFVRQLNFLNFIIFRPFVDALTFEHYGTWHSFPPQFVKTLKILIRFDLMIKRREFIHDRSINLEGF